MSDLDNRLKVIAADIYRHITSEEGGDWLSAQTDMDAIKQAFTDAGYVHFTGTQEQQATIANMMLGNKVMTGREWYERFREEMQGRFIPFARSEDGEVILLVEEIDEAAKRAANIQENQ